MISKKRFWGLALPIWAFEDGSFYVVGSKEELKELSVEGWKEFEEGEADTDMKDDSMAASLEAARKQLAKHRAGKAAEDQSVPVGSQGVVVLQISTRFLAWGSGPSRPLCAG